MTEATWYATRTWATAGSSYEPDPQHGLRISLSKPILLLSAAARGRERRPQQDTLLLHKLSCFLHSHGHHAH